jgi:hypothetical protein
VKVAAVNPDVARQAAEPEFRDRRPQEGDGCDGDANDDQRAGYGRRLRRRDEKPFTPPAWPRGAPLWAAE